MQATSIIFMLFYAYISHIIYSNHDFTVKICMHFLFLLCLLHALPNVPFFIWTLTLPNLSLKINFNWKMKGYWINDDCRSNLKTPIKAVLGCWSVNQSFAVCFSSSLDSDLTIACNPFLIVPTQFILLQELNEKFNKEYAVCNENLKCW